MDTVTQPIWCWIYGQSDVDVDNQSDVEFVDTMISTNLMLNLYTLWCWIYKYYNSNKFAVEYIDYNPNQNWC